MQGQDILYDDNNELFILSKLLCANMYSILKPTFYMSATVQTFQTCLQQASLG